MTVTPEQDLRERVKDLEQTNWIQQYQLDAINLTMQYMLTALSRIGSPEVQATLQDLDKQLAVIGQQLHPGETQSSNRPVMLKQFRVAIRGAGGF